MTNQVKIYYAHCMSIYDTSVEEQDLCLLSALGFEVWNPNRPEGDKMYKTYGMPWFLDQIVGCDALAFRALPDGSVPSGVVMEIQHAIAYKKPVIEIPSGLFLDSRTMTVEETRRYLYEIGYRQRVI